MTNPQAAAAVIARRGYDGHPELGCEVDQDTWLTPRYILDRLGPFDLDPCAAISNPGWVASRFYTKLDDGLTREWCGRVFMNPPFSQTSRWLARHSAHGLGMSLVPSTTESQTWRKCVWHNASAVLLLHGRVRFANPDGSATTGRPLRPVALIAWDSYERGVLERCGLAGVLLTDWRQT